MALINIATHEIHCKIVYYGIGYCGKTTNLQYVFRSINPNVRGEMLSIATETERTLFFDFLPLDLGSVHGFRTRFHLYTVPGQILYERRYLNRRRVPSFEAVASSGKGVFATLRAISKCVMAQL